MSRRLLHELTYAAPAADVAAMLADPEFRKQVCAAQRVTRSEVSVQRDGDHLEVVVDQWQHTAGVPSFAKKFVGEETNVIQAESWATPLLGDIVVTLPGKPGDIRGTARITESDGVSTETVDLTIKVGIPLIGGKLEELLRDLMTHALEAENTAGRAYLSR